MIIKPLGDHCLTVEFDNEISETVNQQVIQLYRTVEKEADSIGVREMIPSFRALLVDYDPEVIRFAELRKKLEQMVASTPEKPMTEPKTTIIPVCYGGSHGEDIEFVAEYNGLSVEEVIKIHSNRKYYVYMIGFIAGFPYLGGMDERIVTPRLETPRIRIPAGSVGIADKQTGVYPLESPGGWQIIGRTPLRLWNHKEHKALLSPGEYVKFEAVSSDEYERILSEVQY